MSAMYLLDTNVVSELRKPKPHKAVLQWIEQAEDGALHISSVTIGEIKAGIQITREQDQAKANQLASCLHSRRRSPRLQVGPAPQESGFLRLPAVMTGMPIIQRAAVECTRPHGMSASR